MLEDLRQLYQDVGRPSLSQLKVHADHEGHEISRGALWDLLNGRGRPRLSTVEAFVAACLRHAKRHRPPILLPDEMTDQARWRARYTPAHPDAPGRGRVAGPARARVPRQLPPAIPRLVGRGEEIDELTAVLKDRADGASPIVVLTGTAGVGTSSLAVWWAHHTADEFPEGQLYVNLRGFDPTGAPTPVEEALRDLLDAFEVVPSKIPQGPAAQSALYRSLVAGRRMLVLLDNAHSAGQVRPLLPAAPGCMTIVTSRTDPVGLVAIEGAHLRTLDLLTPAEARQLLRDRLGESRVAAEPEAVDSIIERCAGLPLALAVVAARATVAPANLTAIAGDLRAARGRLDALTAMSDPLADVRGALSWSYQALSPEAARMFRLLGLHPGPDVDVHAAARLSGVDGARARRALAELARAHLLNEPTTDRYVLHDLLREYARELVAADGEATSGPAMSRMLAHYVALAYAANRLLDPHRDVRIRLVELEPVPPAYCPHDAATAVAWFRAEHKVLVATVHLALAGGHDRYAWQLAWTLSTFLDRDAHWHDWAATMATALLAARRLGHRAAEAIAHRALAHARVQQDRLDEAVVHLEQALAIFHQLGDEASDAAAHNSLGGIRDLQGDHDGALTHSTAALRLFEAAGDEIGHAHALNSVGWCQARLGQYESALASCGRSLALLEGLADEFGQGTAWDSVGFIHHCVGDHHHAVACYVKALALFRTVGDRYYESQVLVHLGDCRRELGHRDAARVAWREGLHILDAIGHPDAESVRDKLIELDDPTVAAP